MILKTLSIVGIAMSFAFAQEQKVETIEIGKKGPDFNLPGVDGQRYSLASFAKAKAVVLIFTCNHCPDAVAARGRIQSFSEEYAKKGVATVAISGNDPKALMLWELGWSVYGDSFDEMKQLAGEIGMTYPYLYDGETQAASLAYGAQATPHCFVLDADRVVRYTGQFDNGRHDEPTTHAVRDAVDALLAGKEVAKTVTRAFGCSTKWSWKRDMAAKDAAAWKALPVTLDDLDPALAKTLAANKTEKLRLINLWSTTCGPCVAEFPGFVDAAQRYQRRGFELVTVSMDRPDDRGDAEKFLQKQHAAVSPQLTESLQKEGRTTNNYLFTGDDADALADALDPEWNGALPHSVLLAPGGEVLWRHTGAVDAVSLRREIVKAIRARK